MSDKLTLSQDTTVESSQSDTLTPTRIAPQIDNLVQGQVVCTKLISGTVSDNTQVSYQVVLIQGHIPTPTKMNGTITVKYNRNQSPTTTWPVSDSKFKALVYLNSGPNGFSLEFSPAGSRTKYLSTHHLIHHPMTSCPAIKLIIVHAKDSQYVDMAAVRSGTTQLSIAMAKYRLTAYMWQIFCAEQMNAKDNPRRTFQLENEWTESTLFSQDIHTDEMRNEAPIHVVALKQTLNEIEQMSESDFVRCVESALVERFPVAQRRNMYFSCLFMDSEWNNSTNSFKRGFAYGGQGIAYDKTMNLAIYGDHLLSTYPTSIDRITAAFSDETLAPSLPEAVKWKCASTGIGAQLQQVFHMLGLQNQAYGILSEESKQFAAMFSLYASQKLIEPKLHPLDMIRLRHHATMRTPFAPIERIRPNTSPTFWAVSESAIFVSSRAGLTAIEVYTPGDKVCKHWFNLLDKRGYPRYTFQVSLNDIMKLCLSGRSVGRIGSFRPGPFSLMVLTADGNATPIADFENFTRRLLVADASSKSHLFRSLTVGASTPGSNASSIRFPHSMRMMGLTVYHTPGVCVAGIEFAFEEGERFMFGNKNGDSSKEWRLRAIDGELLLGMELCVQDCLKGLRLFTSSGRLSPWFGNATQGVE